MRYLRSLYYDPELVPGGIASPERYTVEGELAGNALKAQGKALRTASLSFILAFLAFTIMQCFFTLSGISTRETYFERYQNVWDIMVTVRDAKVENFKETEKVQGLAGVKSAIVYQKARAKRVITEEEMTEEMLEENLEESAADELAEGAAESLGDETIGGAAPDSLEEVVEQNLLRRQEEDPGISVFQAFDEKSFPYRHIDYRL